MPEKQNEILINVRGLNLEYQQKILGTFAKIQYHQYIPKSSQHKRYIVTFLPVILILMLIAMQALNITHIEKTAETIITLFLVGITIGAFTNSLLQNSLTKLLFKNYYSDDPIVQNGYQLALDDYKLQIKTKYSHITHNYGWISKSMKLNDEIWLITFGDKSYLWIYINELGDEETTKQVKEWLKIA